MAGAGYKLFNTGDVLTAAQVNTYLQEQAVMRFANAAARTTALSGVLAEGMVSYLMDTNAVEVYDGSAWVGVATGDITAVTAGTGISGGGTSGAVTITNSMATEITAAGDIIVGTGSGTFDNLPIGTTGQVLTADTTVSPYKVKWASAASGGGMTQLASGSISASTTGLDLTSISSSYNNLRLVVRNLYMASSGNGVLFRINNDSGSNYYGFYMSQNGATSSTGGYNGASNFDIGSLNTSKSSTDGFYVVCDFNDYANTTAWKSVNLYSGGENGNSPFALNTWNVLGYYKSKTAIDRITFSNTGAGFGGGTYILYGVK